MQRSQRPSEQTPPSVDNTRRYMLRANLDTNAAIAHRPPELSWAGLLQPRDTAT